MASNYYILNKIGVNHAAKNGESETLCEETIEDGERGRDILWFGQVSCRVCRKAYATAPDQVTARPNEDEERASLPSVIHPDDWDMVDKNDVPYLRSYWATVPLPEYLIDEPMYGSVSVPRSVAEEHEANEILPEDSPYDEVFTMTVERRMVTATFIKELYAEQRPDMTWQEAYDMAGDPEVVGPLIFMLSSFEDQIGKKIDEVDAPDDVIASAKAIFLAKRDGG